MKHSDLPWIWFEGLGYDLGRIAEAGYPHNLVCSFGSGDPEYPEAGLAAEPYDMHYIIAACNWHERLVAFVRDAANCDADSDDAMNLLADLEDAGAYVPMGEMESGQE